jgi:hypothetical protein
MIQIELVATPEDPVGPEEAGKYLHSFVDWLHGFFHQVAENRFDTDEVAGGPLFHATQIEFLPEVLAEMERDGHFQRLMEAAAAADPKALFAHGLYGAQLSWKFSNINFSLTRFIEERSAALFDRLLDSIDALLDSLLGAVPGGSAVKELKEAVRNSIALGAR